VLLLTLFVVYSFVRNAGRMEPSSVPRGAVLPSDFSTGETSLSKVLCDFEQKEVPTGHLRDLRTYGTMNAGLELMKLATPRLRHKWSIRKEGNSPPDYGLPPDAIFKCGNHPPSDLLNVNPVDLLFVEYSPGPNPRYGDDTPVEGMIARTQATA
jgi:hypothetical protein